MEKKRHILLESDLTVYRQSLKFVGIIRFRFVQATLFHKIFELRFHELPWHAPPEDPYFLFG